MPRLLDSKRLRLIQRNNRLKRNVDNFEGDNLGYRTSFTRAYRLVGSAAGGSTREGGLSRIKKGACVPCPSQWPIAISYHCPVAAMHAATPRDGGTWKEGEGVAGRGRTEGGTKKGQMAPSSSQPSGSGHAPTESEHLPLLPRRRAQENHRLLSFVAKAKGPSSDTDGQSSAALPGPVSYFVSFLLPLFHSYIRFLYPPAARRHDAARVLQDFQFWQMARAGQKDQLPLLSPPPSAILCRVSTDQTTHARQTCKLKTLFTDLHR